MVHPVAGDDGPVVVVFETLRVVLDDQDGALFAHLLLLAPFRGEVALDFDQEEPEGGLAVDVPRRRAADLEIQVDAHQRPASAFHGNADAGVELEGERPELEEDVVIHVSGQAEFFPAYLEAAVGTELDGVGGDGEVLFHRQLHAFDLELHAEALHVGDVEAGFRLVLRVEAAGGQEEALGVARPVDAEGDVTVELDADDVGIIE